LTIDELRAAVKDSRLSDVSIDVARAVLVDGMRQKDASEVYGLTEPRVSAIVKTVEERAAKTMDVAHKQVEMVRADYDVAVAAIRRSMGDALVMVQPEDGVTYHGKVLARTEFHVAQDLGRCTAAIHRLSALDVAPSVGQVVHVRYENGQGRAVVASERRRNDRGRE
jgi:predicted XRE-type DNA-binding protein